MTAPVIAPVPEPMNFPMITVTPPLVPPTAPPEDGSPPLPGESDPTNELRYLGTFTPQAFPPVGLTSPDYTRRTSASALMMTWEDATDTSPLNLRPPPPERIDNANMRAANRHAPAPSREPPGPSPNSACDCGKESLTHWFTDDANSSSVHSNSQGDESLKLVIDNEGNTMDEAQAELEWHASPRPGDGDPGQGG